MSVLMSIFKPRASAGSYVDGGDSRDPHGWLVNWIAGGRTKSGQRVTAETALGLPAYLAALRVGSGDAAKLPLNLMKSRETRGADVALDHPVQRLLHPTRGRFNRVLTGFQGRRLLVHWRMGWGGGHAEIIRDATGVPRRLNPIHPSRVTGREIDGPDGLDIEYDVRNKDGSTTTLASRDVFHLRGMGDAVNGYSIIRYEKETLGLGLAAQKRAAAYFGDGLSKRILALVKEKLSPEGRKGLRRRIKGDQEGDPDGSAGIPIVDGAEAMDLKEFGVNPKDAQFIESLEFFGVEDVSRITGIPLKKLASSKRAQGWSTLTDQEQDYVNGFLTDVAVEVEGEAYLKLLSEKEREEHFFKHVFLSRLRGDPDKRAKYYVQRRRLGTLSANDIRELEDENPIEQPWADEYHVSADLVLASTLGEEATEPAPPAEPTGDDPEDDEGAATTPAHRFRQAAQALRPSFFDAASRFCSRESARIAAAAKRNASNQAAFDSWAEKFYANLHEEAGEAFGSSARCLIELSHQFGNQGSGEQLLDPAALFPVPDADQIRSRIAAGKDLGRIDAMTDRVMGSLVDALAARIPSKEAPRA